MLYVYPPRIINGTLYATNDLVEYTRGKILQTLSIIRGELVADPFFGVPLRLFSSVTDYQSDIARIQSILDTEIPEAVFIVSGYISDKGLFILTVYWSYLGTENTENFEIDINNPI
ncbi:putative tail protein [Nostoc phage YongM]|nr:putative tail protein [Nostoc phage YongM]